MSIDKSDQRVREMFGEIAPKYDRMNRVLSMNVDRYWRWKTVRKTRLTAERPILDVCTGTGDLAIAFCKRAPRDVQVIGADFCPQMLQIANGKQRRANIDSQRLSFVEADAQNLPFEDESFQVVSVAFGLRNIADTERGLAEMSRVCAPGGQVAVLEFSIPRRQPVKSLYGWYFRHVLPRLGQLLARNNSKAYDYLPATVGEFPSYEGLAELMRDSGLKRVEFFPLNFGIATLYLGTK